MFNNGGSSNLWQNLQGYPYQGALWSDAYPLCAAIPNDWPTVTNGNWLHPEGNVFSRNIGFTNTNWTNQSDNAFVYFKEITNNLGNSDPLFVDETNLNLALQSNSPAYTIAGFQPIPFAQIGLESNKMLTIQGRGRGTVTVTPAQADYYPMQFVCLTAVPSNLWYFGSWTGAVSGTSGTVSVWMTNDLAVTAVFQPYVAANSTPLWWLAAYGLATNDAGALGDADEDGCFNWQEYIVGTDPTNRNSRFKIRSIEPDQDGFKLAFPGASNRSYDVEYRTDLLDTNGWRLLTNALPAADVVLEIIDATQGPQRFYRVKARWP
jgi:hypothetical protein